MVCTVKHLVFCQFDISKNSKDEKKNSVTTEIPLKMMKNVVFLS